MTDLRVMTFNLRYAAPDGANSWPDRRPVMADLLRREAPHLLGTQEGLPDQLRDLAADLPDHYDALGTGREGDGRGEAMQVFFDRRRLDALDHGHFWLSDTPDVPGSHTWPGWCPRMVTWVRFADLGSGAELLALNTHLEAADPDTRARSAPLILERLAALPDLPVVLTGDFNEPAEPGSAAYDALVTDGPLVDSWRQASERGPAYATFHDYGDLTPGGARIDWILTTPDLTTRSVACVTDRRDGQWPSDHLPVTARLELETRERMG